MLINPSKHALLKRLKDHIDTNYCVPKKQETTKKDAEKVTEQQTEEISDDTDSEPEVIELPE